MVVVVVVAGAAVVTAGPAVMAVIVPIAFVGRVLGGAGRDVVVVMTGGRVQNRLGFAVVET